MFAKAGSLHALQSSFSSSSAALRYRRYGRRRRLYSLRWFRGGGLHTLSRTSAANARSLSAPRLDSCQSRWRREHTKRSSPGTAEISSLLEAPTGSFRVIDVLVPFGHRPLEMGRPHHIRGSSCVGSLASGARGNRHSTRKDASQPCGQLSVGGRGCPRAQHFSALEPPMSTSSRALAYRASLSLFPWIESGRMPADELSRENLPTAAGR